MTALLRHVTNARDFCRWLEDNGDMLITAADLLGGADWAERARVIVTVARTGGPVTARGRVSWCVEPGTCSDGKDVLFSIQNEQEWQVFSTDILGLPDLPRDPRFGTNSHRVENREALDAVVRPIFAKIPRDDMTARLEAAHIAYGRVSTMEDLAQHPQNRFVEVGSPTGPVRMLAPGAQSNGEIPQPGDVPALGQHTDGVREEFHE